MEAKNGDLQAFLVKHPRMIGALFTVLLILSQVSAAAAAGGGAGGTTVGP